MSRWLSIAVFVLAGVALVVLEVLSRRRSAVPRFGAVVGFALRHRAARVVVYLAWWWLGWHLFAR
jgi:hypothetical protein